MNGLVVALSVSAAFAFSISTTLKKRSANQVPDPARDATAHVGTFVRATLSHPLWLAGLGADGVGLTLQVLALHRGALAVVQPLLVTGLLFALLLRHWGSWRISRAETGWALTLTGCLVAFLWLSGSVSGPDRPAAADRWPAVIAAVAGLAVAASCLLITRRSVPPAGRAALIGVTVGATYAATAALVKTSTNILTSHGPGGLLASWQLYVMLGLGALGLLLTQLAFQAGPLTASLPAISTVDPLLSVALGVLIYDEHLHRGPLYGIVLLVLLLLLATAVIKLSSVEASLTSS